MTTNYQIKIDDSALAYLRKKKKNTVTLNINKSGGGCCPTIEVADIDLTKPENTKLYNAYAVGEITVFVSKIAQVSAPVLRFKLQKTLFFSTLVPVGLRLKGHN